MSGCYTTRHGADDENGHMAEEGFVTTLLDVLEDYSPSSSASV